MSGKKLADSSDFPAAAAAPPTAPWLDGEIAQHLESIVDDLRRLAAARMRRERPDHTLQPTAVAHEVWLRIAKSHGDNPPQTREELLALAATVIRRVLVDHARARNAAKRGGSGGCVPLAPSDDHSCGGESLLLELDEELELLAKLHPRSARVVELRFFGGMKDAAIAAHLGVSDRTVRNDWAVARAWLRSRLVDGPI